MTDLTVTVGDTYTLIWVQQAVLTVPQLHGPRRSEWHSPTANGSGDWHRRGSDDGGTDCLVTGTVTPQSLSAILSPWRPRSIRLGAR